VNFGLDKERLSRVVLEGAVQPVNTILPPGMPGFRADVSPFRFDLDAARRELSASRYGGAEALPPVTLHVSGEGGGAPVMEAVADFLHESIGMSIVIEQSPWQDFQRELEAGVYPVFVLGWAADYPDPQDFLDLLFHSRSPLNHTGYGDAEVDRLLEAARLERDDDARLALYADAERRILDDAPWLPLYTGIDTWLVASYVEGFEVPSIVRPRMANVSVGRP